MKLATRVAVGNRPGYVFKNGVYKKLHKCQYCPYTICKKRNLRLHEAMHGPRESDHKLYKCPHCDYQVGSSGLLSHHLKVHAPGYQPYPQDTSRGDPALKVAARPANGSTARNGEEDDSNSDNTEIPVQQKVDTLLEITRIKKYACEKCPYATAKRVHFTRHSELHGSRQRFSCDFCDYSVPSNNLLTQHRKIHMVPNQNLLASQSYSNLQHLPDVPADVALACALPPMDSDGPVLISVIHDHLSLYENRDSYQSPAPEPQKLYHCERCPYTNVKREHLLKHMSYHRIRTANECLYCDYSAPKKALLTQHLGLHFGLHNIPASDPARASASSGQPRSYQDGIMEDVLKILQTVEKEKKKMQVNGSGPANGEEEAEAGEAEAGKDAASNDKRSRPAYVDAAPSGSEEAVAGPCSGEEEAAPAARAGPQEEELYVCSYCDRQFPNQEQLFEHTMQHMIGNHYEVTAKGRIRQAGKGEAKNSLEAKLEKSLRRKEAAARGKSAEAASAAATSTPEDAKDTPKTEKAEVEEEEKSEPMEDDGAVEKEDAKATTEEKASSPAKKEEAEEVPPSNGEVAMETDDS